MEGRSLLDFRYLTFAVGNSSEIVSPREGFPPTMMALIGTLTERPSDYFWKMELVWRCN